MQLYTFTHMAQACSGAEALSELLQEVLLVHLQASSSLALVDASNQNILRPAGFDKQLRSDVFSGSDNRICPQAFASFNPLHCNA
eukprot:2182227-Amphidinium_carterae.1